MRGKAPTEILNIGGREFIKDTETGAISHQTANCLIIALADGSMEFKIGNDYYILNEKKNSLTVVIPPKINFEINLLTMVAYPNNDIDISFEERISALSKIAQESWIIRQYIKNYAKTNPEIIKTIKKITIDDKKTKLYDIVFQDEAKKAA